MMICVYFIRSPREKAIKIGIASNILTRFSALQSGSAGHLHLIGVHFSGRASALEKDLHERFNHLRLNGEWFSDNGQIDTYIATLQHDDMYMNGDKVLALWSTIRSRNSRMIERIERLEGLQVRRN